MDVSQRNIGVSYSGGKATIAVWAPLARSVHIISGEEKIVLSKVDESNWQKSTEKLQPGDRYQISIDEKKPHPDPASISQPEGVHGTSEVMDLHFDWQDDEWRNPLLSEYIIYELHTGTFSETGDFSGIENKLSYLKELDITAIELMPLAQFSGPRNWGYDGVFPFAVQNSYGGAGALQKLVNACHRVGIAVILDVVYNHLGPEGNYLPQYGPCFTDKYNTPWGHAINYDDAWSDGVRRFFIENALMWLRDFHIDALRLDAVHAIRDFGAVHFLQELRQQVDKLEQHTGRRYWLIAESELNDPKTIQPLSQNGYGMDAQWIDEFHHALRVTAGEKRYGYYEDFNGLEHLAKSYRDAYVYDGMFSPHRKKHFGKPTNGNGDQFVVFSQNHDQVGNRPLGERSSILYSFEMQKTMAAAVLLSPYVPLLFMGEEWAETNPFLYFVSHEDEALCEAVRKGRAAEFEYFFRHADAEPPDPTAEETFNRSKLQWHLKKEGKHAVMLQYYKELIRLRKQHPLLRKPDRNNLHVIYHKENGLLILLRKKDGMQLQAVFNFSDKIQEVCPGENPEILFYSAATQWKGTEEMEKAFYVNRMLPPASVVLLQKETGKND